jgi:hypothetical protein
MLNLRLRRYADFTANHLMLTRKDIVRGAKKLIEFRRRDFLNRTTAMSRQIIIVMLYLCPEDLGTISLNQQNEIQ